MPQASPARDIHSFARPSEARVTHVALDWTVDFASKRIVGSATNSLSTAQGARRLVLDTRALEITGCELLFDQREVPAAWSLAAADPILGSALSIELAPGVRAVRVRYATAPEASGLQWLEPELTSGKRHPYLFSQAQAIHARSMLPCQDSPDVRVSYTARVRVPRELQAVMSASEREVRGPGDFEFRMPQAIPPYLIALAVGELAFVPTGPRTGVWSEPSVVDAAAREFSDLESMLLAVESMFGPYRWGRYDVLVLPPSFPFGGMENPCMTFATPTLLAGDKSLVNVIAHELAHSWSGNLVTNATWRDFWLNEGFTVYLERRIVERIYGERRATQQAILGKQALLDTLAEFGARPDDTRLFLDLAGRDPDDGLTDVAYEKGALFLLSLERAYGRERFDAFLREWFDVHAFRSATTQEFERFLHARLLDGSRARADELHVSDWIYGMGLREDAPDFDSSVFAAQERAAAAFASGSMRAQDLGAERWSTDEWLRFLGRLPEPCSSAQLAELDAAWKLGERRNAEIACAWLERAIQAEYAPAWPRLEQFLVEVGRRKFLKPLYTEMVKTAPGIERAEAIYERARPGYHPIARCTIDALLAAAKPR